MYYSVTNSDVLIIGAGVIGLSCAYKLSKEGLKVILADPNPGKSASWAAAGMLAPVFEVKYAESSHVPFNIEARRAWPSFAKELTDLVNCDIDFKEGGTLQIAKSFDDLTYLMELAKFCRSLGFKVDNLSPREVRQLEPSLSPQISGGFFNEVDAQVNNRLLVDALIKAVKILGAEIILESIRELKIEKSRIIGAKTDNEEFSFKYAVICLGSYAKNFPYIKDYLTIFPIKGQILRLKKPEFFAERIVRAVVNSRTLYIVPRSDDEVVLGATQEDTGFDDSISLGPLSDLMNDALLVAPFLYDSAIRDITVGFRPNTVDNMPVVDWLPAENLAVSCGHFRNGILQAPISAEIITKLILGQKAPEAYNYVRYKRLNPNAN
jgi:glycine oxidase